MAAFCLRSGPFTTINHKGWIEWRIGAQHHLDAHALMSYLRDVRGRCVMVRPQPSKLMTRVRFPPPAPFPRIFMPRFADFLLIFLIELGWRNLLGCAPYTRHRAYCRPETMTVRRNLKSCDENQKYRNAEVVYNLEKSGSGGFRSFVDQDVTPIAQYRRWQSGAYTSFCNDHAAMF